MKIALCASMAFAKKMLEVKKQLEASGHDVIVQHDIMEFATGKVADEDKWRKLQTDPIKGYFEKIKQADAVLVVNEEKSGIQNYIGGNTLMEMGFAYVLNKRIYLLNQVPQLSYTDEIIAMKPIILEGNLKRIIENG